ncbi:hypothetical protein IFM89_022586 [Coptis chinensis]|uniref:UVR domain-containing protein n=1 Tax=Coptis chinensis TaxID=261450 RepID=A0A835IE76_9MAGN|nr:hypothetical protein IFM89_022586 [Coptis chinensis]
MVSREGTILDEQTLERDLQIAIDEENYAQAAKIRDSLRFLQEDSKASVLAANARFYKLFEEWGSYWNASTLGKKGQCLLCAFWYFKFIFFLFGGIIIFLDSFEIFQVEEAEPLDY